VTLNSGTRLGPYEVAEQIGAGGMGVVYRATDTELERDVAIKVLPATFAEDADRLARFEQEAKTLAALNHPNVAHIHGLERGEGVTALVMELVDGPTLADRIEQGPLPPDEALSIALQITEGLEAAHERGIVHRDLKPANVKLRADGTVKILDFGIAKALDSGTADSGPVAPSLTTPAMTQAGMILGTAAYMSPEQARGKHVDRRADIWAFGCVLYEMLTGQPAFGGEDVPITLARVLAYDADMTTMPKAIAPGVRQTLELCLRKDPKKRIADIADVRLALKGELAIAGATDDAAAHVPAVTFWRRPLAVGAAMLVVGAGLAGLAAAILAPAPAAPPVNRFDVDWPRDLVARRSGENVVAFAPDGRHYVLNTDAGLYLRAMDELEGRLLPGTEEDLHTPFFSPDGRQVAYWTATRQLKRIGISGGAPVVVASLASSEQAIGGADNLRGGSWEDDNTILLAIAQGIQRVPASGGAFEVLIQAGEGEIFQSPSLLPDGDGVLFSVVEGGDWNSAQIVVQSIASGERKLLIEGGTTPRYVVTGHLVYSIGSDLFGIAFDVDERAVSGSVVPLVQGVAQSLTQVAGLSNFGLADDGTLLYLEGDAPANLRLEQTWVDRDGRPEPAANVSCLCLDPALSPDGTRVAFTQFDLVGGTVDIWIFSFAQQTFTRLTFGSGQNASAVWSPDSRRIAFGNNAGLFVQNADGTGTPERLLEAAAFPLSWSENDEILYRIQREGSAEFDLGALGIDGEPAPREILSLGLAMPRAQWSPDQRWLAYVSEESGRAEIYVRPYPDIDSGRWQVSSDGGEDPHWSDDGSALFFLGPRVVMRADVENAESFRFDTPEPLFSTAEYVVFAASPRRFDVAADGERLLMARLDTGLAVQNRVIVVQNWVEELKRLVPVD
jgi:Tol biopolymer transport system component